MVVIAFKHNTRGWHNTIIFCKKPILKNQERLRNSSIRGQNLKKPFNFENIQNLEFHDFLSISLADLTLTLMFRSYDARVIVNYFVHVIYKREIQNILRNLRYLRSEIFRGLAKQEYSLLRLVLCEKNECRVSTILTISKITISSENSI